MRFELRPPFIIFHDKKPGQHATMIDSNGENLPFRGDASSFSDAKRTYAWAFEGTMADGDRIVFATDDREVAGVVRNGKIELENTEKPTDELPPPVKSRASRVSDIAKAAGKLKSAPSTKRNKKK